MSVAIIKCPFCDSSVKRVRTRTRSTWEDISKIVSCYFSNFTYDLFLKLCDSCFTYTEEFGKSKKLWLTNEAQIHKKRMMGQFKGLGDIVNFKKKSYHICRLCFGGSPAREVIFIYHENKIYQPGYIQNILNLHASNIDLTMTENPVICLECLDGIQTFDALYQMCLENQASKSDPDLKVKSSSDSQPCGSAENGTDKIVHIQLKRSSNSTLVLHSVTEAESAVNSLMSNGGASVNSVVLNGWTTKKVFDLVQNPKYAKLNNTKSQDICVISDEDNESLSSSTVTTGPDSNIVHELDLISDNIEKEKITSEVDTTSLKSDIIEIDDSDEEEGIVVPSILDIATVIESDETLELQPQFNTGDVEIDQDMEAIPTAEINMSAVGQLLSDIQTEHEIEPKHKENSGADIEASGESFLDDSSDSNISHILRIQSKVSLEENLSDFLQFNKEPDTNASSDCSKRSNESMYTETCKKVRTETSSDLGTYSSAYERFLFNESEKDADWKLLRGVLSDAQKNDEYCTWFPFYAHTKKCFPSNKRKCYMTALENRDRSRIYRCNVCLEIMYEESSARNHDCLKYRGRKRLICSILKCGFYTYNDFLFSQHKKAHTILSNEAMQEYKCSSCEFFSADSECMINHVKSVHSKGAVQTTITKCQFCFFESQNPDILAHHISVRHTYKRTKFTEKHFS